MAKRSRGSTRPGQRRPNQRQRPTSQRPQPQANVISAPRPTNGLTEAEETRAAELEAGIVEQERAADAVVARRRSRERNEEAEPALAARGRPRGSLAVRYADEYAYVRRDLRDIGLLAAVLVAILLALWVLIDVAAIIKI